MRSSLPTSPTARLLGLILAVAFAAAPAGAAEETKPEIPEGVKLEKYDPGAFRPDPNYQDKPYDPKAQERVYGGKSAHTTPKPLFWLGQDQYKEGPLDETFTWFFGEKNPARPALSAYGDLRTGFAFNDNGNVEKGIWGNRLNLDIDLRLTSTERLHAFFRPFDRRKTGQFSGCDFAGNDRRGCDLALDANPETAFFEGDIASLYAGWAGEYLKFDLPITFGLVPLFAQNGIWLDDAMLGGAVSIPAINLPALGIANMDVTFFAGVDNVNTNAMLDPLGRQNENAARIYGAMAFVEVLSGYIEAGYAFTDDKRAGLDFSYHNMTFGFTKRYWATLAQSVRIIGNVGQDPGDDARGRSIRETANGAVILVENSFVTHKPYTLLPYANFFFGYDRPQSAARDNGGVLKNVGINFETDNLTGFPKLDDTAASTWGGAVGVQYLFDLDQQIVGEFATVQTWGPDQKVGRQAKGNQYGFGLRYQIPVNERVIFRADAMYGIREFDDDIKGVRVEVRTKF